MPVAAAVGAITLIAIIAYAVLGANSTGDTQAPWDKAQLNDDAGLPGTYIAPHPGEDGTFPSGDDRQHFANSVSVPICTAAQLEAKNYSKPLCYHSNPPTSGPHAASPMAFGILKNPTVEGKPSIKENLIHNMEHGGVVIWYNTSDAAVIKQLEDIAQEEIDRRKLLVMAPYPELEPDTIALTGWTRLDKFPASQINKKRIVDFIEEHQRRFNPEGF